MNISLNLGIIMKRKRLATHDIATLTDSGKAAFSNSITVDIDDNSTALSNRISKAIVEKPLLEIELNTSS